MNTTVYGSPVGCLLLEADERGLCAVRLMKPRENAAGQACASPFLMEAVQQLDEYFAGQRTSFDLPLSARGTAFEQTVWAQLSRIPFGETRTYGQIAATIGKPSASRAVGAACGRNPLLIVVPCHRVIGSTGRLTGFAAGLQAKRTLLAHEGFDIFEDRIRITKQAPAI